MGRNDPRVKLRHDRPERASTPPESDSHSKLLHSGGVRRARVRGGGTVGCHPTTPLSSADPLTVEEISEGTLTEDMLRAATGWTRRLEDVTRLTLVIDSLETSVEGVWASVPSLHTLVLDGSRLLSFRDLGVGLRHLNTLSLEASDVEDLDGIGALSGLRQLRLAGNRVSDVTPLACHGNLQVLGLERNRISDMNALEILGTLPLLYSLDLGLNPLMESLGKLVDGRGRGVVHQLIPQMKILDGTHLSGEEGGAVGVETLHEADDLICQGASRARAAWAEEGATGATDRRGRGGTGVFNPREGYSSRRRSRDTTVAVRDGGRSPPEDRGIVHWDSDLTQGGGQAFSGNPSSAIRRHKMRCGVGKRRASGSTTLVLETLDLAKKMEQGLKHRHWQMADRVSEWRKETFSDSLPQEDPPSPPPGSASSIVAPFPLSSPSKHLPTGARKHGRSVSPVPCRDGTRSVAELRVHARAAATDGGEGGRSPTMWTPSPLTAAAADAVAAGESERDFMLARSRKVLDRPWTTGDFGRSMGAAAHSTLLLPSSSTGGGNNIHQTVDEREVTNAVAVRRGGGVERRRLRRRPQTAAEPGRHSCRDSDEMPGASWQPVWESLQGARLVSPQSVSAVSAGGGSTRGLPERGDGGGLDRIRSSVDFRGQRRARTTVRSRSGRMTDRRVDGGDFESDSSSTSSSAGEAAGGNSNGESEEEAGDRNQIKRRASEFTCAAPDSVGVVVPPSVEGGPTALLYPASASSGVSTGRETDDEVPQTANEPPPLQSCAESLPPKGGRCRQTANMTSRRILDVLDDSSSTGDSSGGEDRQESEDMGRKSTGRSSNSGCGGGGDGGGSTAYNGSVAGVLGRGENPAQRRSSIRASRMLGFDLRKSLAAIDEWTDKAVTTNKDGCGSTPRQFGLSTAAGPPDSCLVDDAKTARGSSVASKQAGRGGGGKGGGGDTRDTNDSGGSTRTKSSKAFTVVVAAPATTDGTESDDDGSGDEAVISVAAARAALGISKGAPPTPTAATAATAAAPALSGPTTSTVHKRAAPRPSRADIDCIAERRDGGSIATMGGVRRESSSSRSGGETHRAERRRGNCTAASPSSLIVGLGVSMSDEALTSMLQRQPRTVPELRTKESFREFFVGMDAERMDRLLRGAYEGTLPADEVDRKVEKRLGLVGDVLAW